MPGLNRRGPNSEGSMTGKKKGRCNPDNKGKANDEILQNRSETNPEQGNSLVRGSGKEKGRGLGKGTGRGKAMRSRGNV